MSFSLAVHKHADGRLFITIVDSELVGRKIEEGDLVLDVSSPYYRGEDADEERIAATLARSYSASFVGERAVALAEKSGFVESANVVRIGGVPSAQSLVMS